MALETACQTPSSCPSRQSWHINLRIQNEGRQNMPTLFRFLFVLATLAAMVYGVMWSLVTFVEPREREVTVRVPSERVNPTRP